MNLYVGTSGYAYTKWKGAFYPKDLPAKQMLHYYGEHFEAVEINGTYYRMPTAAGLKAWTIDVPTDFKFVLKAPQLITHWQKLKNADDSLQQFLDAGAALQKHLGPLLFQLPPKMKKDVPLLRDFLALLPSRCRAAFEFRHQSWFEEEVFDLLRKHKVALCIADADDDLKIPFIATTDWGYLRLRRLDYDKTQLKKWVKTVQKQDWRDVFVFFRHEDTGKGPLFAERFLELATQAPPRVVNPK